MRMIARSKMNEWLHWHGPRLDIVRCLCITKETKHLKIKYNKHLILIRLDFVHTGDISNCHAKDWTVKDECTVTRHDTKQDVAIY